MIVYNSLGGLCSACSYRLLLCQFMRKWPGQVTCVSWSPERPHRYNLDRSWGVKILTKGDITIAWSDPEYASVHTIIFDRPWEVGSSLRSQIMWTRLLSCVHIFRLCSLTVFKLSILCHFTSTHQHPWSHSHLIDVCRISSSRRCN